MKKVLLATCAVALTVGGLTPVGSSPASADPASAGSATGYGTNVNLAGTPLVDRAGLAQVALPPGGDVGPKTLVLVPAAPLAVNGTAIGIANAHQASDIPTSLQVVPPTVAPPYNLRGIGETDGLDVLAGTPTPIAGLPDVGVSIVTADAVRAEAAGVCRSGTAQYGAASEVVNLKIGGAAVPLNGPLTSLVDALDTALQPLALVADIQRNEVVVNANGAAVNALHVTVLGGIGVPATTPVLDLIVGHAEVSGLSCAPVVLAQCSDNKDNDGDGKIDAQDPGCLDSNGVYDPNDNDERNPAPPSTAGNGSELARTGGESQAPLAGGLAFFGLAVLALRRRGATR